MIYIIEIINRKEKCWVAPWEEGDPPRTLVKRNAQVFRTIDEAKERLLQIIPTHPFRTMTYLITTD